MLPLYHDKEDAGTPSSSSSHWRFFGGVIKFLIAAVFVLAIGVHTASAAGVVEHSLGSFYAGQDVETIDVDGDGDIDVVATAYAAGGGIYWYENDGAGSFTKHNIHTSSSYDYMHLDAGDIDGDTDIDVVVSDRNGYVFLYTNDGSENFARSTVASGLYDPQRLKMGDLDDDGDIDIIVPNGAYTSTWVGNIRWYENDGAESFTSRYLDSNQPDAYSADYGDLDGDGDVDVIGLGNTWGSTEKYMSDGAVDPSFSITSVSSGAQDVEILDMDGDSDLDFVTVSWYNLKWYENDGSASFTVHTINTDLDDGTALRVEDIDSDGDYDILVAEVFAGISWWENDGSFNFTENTVVGAISSITVFADVADIDGGGDMEIVCFGSSDTLSWFEIIADATPPTVSTLSPADDATGVAVDANLVITFDEAVDVESGDITIKKTADNSTVETIAVTSGQVTGTGTTTITINPTADFASETGYYVQIDATAFDDTASNSFAGISDTTTWSFTSADSIAPSISSLSPADGAVGINFSDNLVITFDEAVDVESGNITIKKTSDDTTVETIDVTSSQVTGTGTTTITIDPSTSLVDFSGQGYYVQIDTTAFDDAASNSYAGIADTTTWNFTMAAPSSSSSSSNDGGSSDRSAPYVVAFTPANSATGVSEDARLQIIFNETVYATGAETGDLQIFKAEDGSWVSTPKFNGIEVTGWGSHIITIDPPDDFEQGVKYYVMLAPNTFHDENKNYFGGIPNGTTWVFTVGGGEEATTPNEDSAANATNDEGNSGSSESSSSSSSGSSNASGSNGAGWTVTVDGEEQAGSLCTDMVNDHWAFEILSDLMEEGMYPVSQDEDGFYSCLPQKELTRGAMINWIVTIEFGSQLASFDIADWEAMPFSDINEGDEYFAAVLIAHKNGIISGYSDGTFRAGNTVNRAEALKILWQTFVHDEEEMNVLQGADFGALADIFEDLTAGYDWYYPYLLFAKEHDFIEGRTKFMNGAIVRLAEMYSPVLYSEVAKLIYLMH